MEALLAGVLAALAVAGCGYMAVFMAKALGTTRILIAGATTCEAMPKVSCPDRSAQIAVTVS